MMDLQLNSMVMHADGCGCIVIGTRGLATLGEVVRLTMPSGVAVAIVCTCSGENVAYPISFTRSGR